MKKLKDLCLETLINEGEEVFSISPSEVESVIDVDIVDDDIKIRIETSYGKKVDLIVKMEAFKRWSQKKESKNTFKSFVVDFLKTSKEYEGLNEIVDDDGNIDLDDGMPSNATNSMVTSPKFDLEKIYKSFVPKSIRFYSGDMGMGSIVW